MIHNKWILKVPKQPLAGPGYHKNDSYRELPLLMKINNDDVEVEYHDKTIHCWIEPNILTYDRPTLNWINNEVVSASLVLLGNGDVNLEGKQIMSRIPSLNVKPWTFWPRKPMLLEKILEEHTILKFDQRPIESIFIGNIENQVQLNFRSDKWENVVEEFHLSKGKEHKFTHKEYLHKLMYSKYGLFLRGYGSKCHREVELMALGCVPIITKHVNTSSYMNPMEEDVHFIYVDSPSELTNKINKITSEKWNEMSNACIKWYENNVHSKIYGIQ